ncbi:MAG: glycosyltransferase family protein [Dehalococcoidia bacterium]
MKIALVAAGHLPIPPVGWGAVEDLVWNFKLQLEAAGHTIELFNSVWFNEVIVRLNREQHDFIHLHCDLYCGDFTRHLRQPFCVTSHYGGFARFAGGEPDPNYEVLFRDTLAAPGNIVFSDEVTGLYRREGYRGFLRLLPNPVDVPRFGFREAGNGRAICLGRIQPRKRQAELARLLNGRVPLDFAGPHDPIEEPNFSPRGDMHELGSWSREEVYARLSEYSCLVLLSRSEGDPLVVKEALAAGLSVVVNGSSAANLSDEPFITVLPDAERDPAVVAAAINEAIAHNHGLRADARAYAQGRYAYAAILPGYLRIAEEFAAVRPG